jgi:vesicle transport protein SEC22
VISCVNANGIIYLTLCDKAYPRKLAFAFLADLQREFEERFLKQVDRATKPYPFVKFGLLFC